MKKHKNKYCKTCFEGGFNIARTDLLEKVMETIQKSEWIHPKCKVKVIMELKKL